MATNVLKRLSKFFDRKHTDSDDHPVVQTQDHPIEPQAICPKALQVVRVLQENNFEAYLVGGCIRDLLLGLSPKDFDVATNAKPHEIKPLFKRSRVVGRRFQIVHVQFGRDIIEVTTFRSSSTQKDQATKDNRHIQQSATGLLTRDNVFGSNKDDAHRRDLTVNALYFDPISSTIYDFCQGLKDLEKKKIRIIGDPTVRYREDPVRLLRVVRFTAKLGFDIEPQTLKPMAKMAQSLFQVSAPRLFDETLKLFMNGQGLAVFKLLNEFGLFAVILPQTHRLIEQGNPLALRLIEQAFENTDLRIKRNQRVTPAFIYAALLWPAVQQLASSLESRGQSPSLAISKAANEVISNQIPITAIPRRFTIAMHEIWSLQLSLPKRAGQRAKRLSEHPRFRAAYDFVLLREQAGENLRGLGDWWTKYQQADKNEQQKMVQILETSRPRKRRQQRKKQRTD
jgi:poly(A) polymerase